MHRSEARYKVIDAIKDIGEAQTEYFLRYAGMAYLTRLTILGTVPNNSTRLTRTSNEFSAEIAKARSGQGDGQPARYYNMRT